MIKLYCLTYRCDETAVCTQVGTNVPSKNTDFTENTK